MSNKRHQASLRAFVAEIKQLDLPAFVATDQWCLLEDLLNGVHIGYSLASASDRKILHHIGQRYGLIPLCPGEVVDMEMVDGALVAVVRTSFGALRIQRRK